MLDRISLVVDDEPVIRLYISTVLKLEGFQSIEAGDGAHGLRVVQELGDVVDLIVGEIQMPGGDGISFAQAVKKAFPEFPVILVSGRGEPAENFDGFVEKPFHARELLEAVRNAVAKTAVSVALE